jgi:hypothetical protein
VPSINRVFFLSLGGVCFLIIPFFWLALTFDYKALENFMITLSDSYFVGYPIPELFGASSSDSVVSKVFRLKIFLSLALLFYSLFFISLYSIEENFRRLRFLFRGISIPLFLVVVAFWLKFVGEDHIVVKSEKNELFIATTISLVFSILLFAYSFRSQKKTRRIDAVKVSENVSTSSVKQTVPPVEQTVSESNNVKEIPPPDDLQSEIPEQQTTEETSMALPTQIDSTEIDSKSDSKEISLSEEGDELEQPNKQTQGNNEMSDLPTEDLDTQSTSSEENLSEEVIKSTMNQIDAATSVENPNIEISENEKNLSQNTLVEDKAE